MQYNAFLYRRLRESQARCGAAGRPTKSTNIGRRGGDVKDDFIPSWATRRCLVFHVKRGVSLCRLPLLGDRPAAPYDFEDQVLQIAGRDAGNATCLGKRFGANPIELLASLRAQAVE